MTTRIPTQEELGGVGTAPARTERLDVPPPPSQAPEFGTADFDLQAYISERNSIIESNRLIKEEEAPTRGDFGGNFSSVNRFDFEQGQLFLREQYDLADGISGAFLNRWAQDFFNENGRWPSLQEMMGQADFFTQAERITVGSDLLPPMFYGFEDGQLYINNAGRGVDPVPGVPRLGDQFDLPDQITFPQRIIGSGESFVPGGGTLVGEVASVPSRFVAGVIPGSAAKSAPVVSLALIDQLRELLGGGRRGGGGGRAGPVFDMEAIRQSIRSMWGQYMIEEPENLDALVSEFVDAASAFPGSLSLESWLLSKMESTSRYQALYGQKPPNETPLQYQAKYVNAVGQFGLPQGQAQSEVERGLETGAGLAGFTEGLSRTRAVQRQRSGAFSQRIQSVLQGLAVR